jgi:uncharacterized iron-regulated protein
MRSSVRALCVAAAALASSACTQSWMPAATGPTPQPNPAGVAPMVQANDAAFRVFESATGRVVPFSTVISAASTANVVFFGEQHDDPETHFLEFGLLEGLGQRLNSVVLSLEMFERDVQPSLEQYLSGAVSESTFLTRSRPWPRYATDYRPMVQLARVRGWKVVAANIPRPMASAIARKGMPALDTLTTLERSHASATMGCSPNTPYFDRFSQAMGGMGGHGPGAAPADASAAQAQMVRVYEAQCAKDETMAESIVDASRSGHLVYHVNGAFHSDYSQGTAERVRRRMPNVRILTITAVPVANPGTAVLGEERAKADYVIFTRKP